MHKTWMAGLAGLSLLAGGAAAAAENPVYVGGGAVVQSATNHDDGLGVSLKGGVKLDQVSPGFAIEGEFTRSLFDPERDNFRGSSSGDDTSFTTLGGYAAYSVPFPDRRIAVRGRLGLVWEQIDPEGSGSDDELHISWGAGGEYRLSSELTTFLEYTRIESDLSQLTGGVLVHF
jgi:hypothetical protein